jgi:hypothetical protein
VLVGVFSTLGLALIALVVVICYARAQRAKKVDDDDEPIYRSSAYDGLTGSGRIPLARDVRNTSKAPVVSASPNISSRRSHATLEK